MIIVYLFQEDSSGQCKITPDPSWSTLPQQGVGHHGFLLQRNQMWQSWSSSWQSLAAPPLTGRLKSASSGGRADLELTFMQTC